MMLKTGNSLQSVTHSTEHSTGVTRHCETMWVGSCASREVEMGCEMRMDQPPKQNIVNGTPDLDRGVIGMISPLGQNVSR